MNWIEKANQHLDKCDRLLDDAELLNDFLEGWYGVKYKPSEEWDFRILSVEMETLIEK
jgi:hypothetical protein